MEKLIYGQSGAVALVGIIMGFIKKAWKPKNKHLYWIPAGLLSLASTLAITFMVGFNWLTFGATLVLVAGGQLFLENEAFSGIKELLLGLVDK